MAGLHFEITGDNKSVINALNETERKIKSVSSSVEKEGGNIDRMFERIKQSAAMFAAGFTTKELVMNIVNVRGEFQKLSVAFETMLGSKEKADSLMKQMVETAATTPFGLQDVAGGAKQLLAYGVAAEDVNETLIRLGDIAAGLSIPLGDLVYLYGTTRAQGRLYTEDFNQFTSRGIPMIEMLADKFGVAENEVKGLVEAGKVGFPEVQEVIQKLTDEGGKFGGLMEAQSKTISGQISNIEDAFETMFNEIGRQNEGVINASLSSVSYLVEHWEAVAAAIESAAIAYGTYKAAVMTTAALQGAESTLKVDTEIAGLKEMLGVTEEVKNADLAAAVASGKLSEAKAAEVASLRESLAVKISTLEADKLMAEQEYASAAANLASSQNRLKAAEDAIDGIDDWIARAEELGDTELANRYRVELGQKSIELQNASIAKNSAEKALNAAATRSKSATEALNTVTVQANTVANNANAASMNIMKLAAIQLSNIMKSLWATLMANPLLLVAGAAAGLAYAVYKVATAETEAEKIERRYSEAVSDATKKLEERRKSIEELIRKIEDDNTAEGERIKAFESLKAAYPEIFDKYATEEEYLKNIAEYKKRIAEEDSRRAGQGDEENLRLLQNQLNYLRNRKAEGINLVDLDGNGWTTDDVDEAIKAQLEIINKAKAKIGDAATESFLSTINDLDDSRISEVLDGIENSLRAIGNSGDNAIAIVSELGGEFSKPQLKTIKNALETELEERSGEKLSPESWLEVYKKEYLSAKKTLEDFMNSESDLSEKDYKETFKKLTDAKDEAEKKYKQAGGKVDTESSINKAKKEAEQIKKEQEQLADDLLQLRFKNQQDEINLMEEGREKKKRQLELDYQMEISEIQKMEKKWSEKNGGTLTMEQSVEISRRYAYAEAKYDKGVSDLTNDDVKKLQSMLEKYQDYAAQRKSIEKQMNDDIAFLQSQRTEANSDEIDRAIKVAKDKAKEAIKVVTDEENKALAGQDNTFLKMLFGDVSQMAFSDLSGLISQARQLRDYLSGKGDKNGITFISPEQLKAIEESPEELDKLKKALDKLLDSGKKSHLEEIFDTFRKGFADLQSAKGFKDISGAIGTISGAAGDAAGKLSEMFDAMGNTAVADALGGVQQVMNAVSNIGQGFAKGGIVGGIAAAIGEAANFIGQAFSANQRHKEALKQVMNEAIAQQREYNLLLMKQNLLYEKATTIFGTDSYVKAANSVNVMKDAISELNEALKGTSEQQEKQNTKPILGRMMNGVTGYYSELKSLYAGLADVDIKTGHKKTGLFGWGKGKDIYSSVLDVYPELISANGELNKELAETIINTREMSDEDKAALQNMIDLAEQAEEAYETLNDYMTDIFGELGGSMSDALVDAFKNGTDAASAFADSVSGMLETLAEQMVYSVTLAPIMEEAQNAMLDVMKDTGLSEEQKFSKWTDILGGLISDVTEQQQMADRLYQQFKESAREQGFDIFIPDSGEYASAIEGLEELQRAYEKLSEASSKVFSSEAVKILKQQNENLNEQISIIRKRIDEENRSANPDTDYLDELKGQLEDINAQIEDNKEAMKDAIFGEDIQSAISNFVSAYSEALGNGGSMQKMSKDFVESMVQSMVTESMKADASPVMENIREKLIEAWKDGVVTADEQLSIEEIVNNLNKELSDKYGWAEGLFGESDIEGLEALQSAYDKLSDSVSNAYSSEKAELLKQQSEILRQQRDLIQERLEAEKALGERGDASLVNEWEEQLEEVNSKIEENKEAQLDAIFGQNTQTQISNLANALINVWSGAEKKADSAKDFINGIIKSMVLEALSMDLTPFIDSLREQMAEMFKDGIISAEEGDALAGMVEGVMDSLEKQYAWADRFIKEEEEVVEEIAETFSNITFESMRDDFTSQLSDMETSYEDMCNNFEEKLKESIIRGFIQSKYQSQIQNLISTWDMYGDSENIDSDEMEKLREQYKELISSMIKDRDELAEQFGWSKLQQEATSKGFGTMSQDSADELNGRFTALYEVGLQILQYMTYMQNVTVCVDSCCSILSEMRELAITGNSYLEDISLYSKKINECITKKLDEINNNLKNIL